MLTEEEIHLMVEILESKLARDLDPGERALLLKLRGITDKEEDEGRTYVYECRVCGDRDHDCMCKYNKV